MEGRSAVSSKPINGEMVLCVFLGGTLGVVQVIPSLTVHNSRWKYKDDGRPHAEDRGADPAGSRSAGTRTRETPATGRDPARGGQRPRQQPRGGCSQHCPL